MKSFRFAVAAILLSVVLPALALAQTPSLPPGPYNAPPSLSPVTAPNTLVFTDTLAGPGTATKPLLNNVAALGIMCKLNVTVWNTPATVALEVDAYDQASNSYLPMVTTAALAAVSQSTIVLYPGSQTASLPTGFTAVGLHLPRIFQIKRVIAGGGGTVSDTVGCELLR